MMKKALNRKGFTIIELVIIILVLGVLAAVSIGRLTEGLETAQVEHTKAEMDAIATAVAGSADKNENARVNRNRLMASSWSGEIARITRAQPQDPVTREMTQRV